MTSPEHASTIAWLPWDADAFALAARERRPVLLSISAPWCAACHEMDRTTWADPRVGALVRDGFVAIRVNSDRRPDINERYNLGGWPTTAFLTPRADLLGGGTFVPAERMPDVLARVRDAFTAHADRTPSAPEQSRPAATSDVSTLDDLVAQTFASFDAQCGGFGTEPKFPLAAPVQLALDLYAETGDERMEHIARATLSAMADGDLHDRIDGGFFRYAAARDWQLPHREKLLEPNAHLLRLYATAARVFDDRTLAAVARRTIEYVAARLTDPEGGYYGSEDADEGYYGAADRMSVPRPRIDRTFYADANAAMAGALIAAGRALEDAEVTRGALRSLERVLLACYRPGEGVAHYLDGGPRVRGLLGDQIGMIHTLLDAHEAAGSTPYLMMAQELGYYALRTLYDERAGLFLDRAPAADAIGLLREPCRPFAANCIGARALLRLGRAAKEPAFTDAGRRVLSASAAAASAHGPLAAHYVLAVREFEGVPGLR